MNAQLSVKNLTAPASRPQAEFPTVEERIAAGKALRQQFRRRDHALYQPAADRDPVAILEAQAKTRLPDLVPVRYARMLTSPFAFLRGSAAVMIADIAAAPKTGLNVQACGDMHLANFGVFASAERSLVFGINDFDETYPGAWEWDLKRLVASAVVAGRFLGADAARCEAAARAIVQSYRHHMHDYAQLGYLDLWYDTITEAELLQALPEELQKKTSRILTKARGRGHLQVLDKMTDLINGEQRIVEASPFVVQAKSQDGRPMAEALEPLLQDYFSSLGADRHFLVSRYRILDVARKVVGVGSVGTRCWVVYLQGADATDPLFLQVKEAQPSVLAPYMGDLATGEPSDITRDTQAKHQGHRVVAGQRLIQGAPDIFLGWGELDGVHYYVRQLRDMKGSVQLEPGKFRTAGLPDYGRICGWALAMAHAKSGDAAMLAGYLGKSDELDEALAKFAVAYADQTERDYDLLLAAARAGRIQVASDY